MTCNKCHGEIGPTQCRHSDGLGTYHLFCELNEEREKHGWPKIESVKRVKYYSGFEALETEVKRTSIASKRAYIEYKKPRELYTI